MVEDLLAARRGSTIFRCRLEIGECQRVRNNASRTASLNSSDVSLLDGMPVSYFTIFYIELDMSRVWSAALMLGVHVPRAGVSRHIPVIVGCLRHEAGQTPRDAIDIGQDH